ncbi:hypothetical protein ACLOJK_041260 [Asimina triloba]
MREFNAPSSPFLNLIFLILELAKVGKKGEGRETLRKEFARVEIFLDYRPCKKDFHVQSEKSEDLETLKLVASGMKLVRRLRCRFVGPFLRMISFVGDLGRFGAGR